MSVVANSVRWFWREFGLASIHQAGRNAYLIILARTCRMFAYGTNALVLAIFFSALKISDSQIGVFMTLTLVGDVVLGTLLSLMADRIGRRKVLLGGQILMITSGVIFACFENFWILLFGAIVGVISVTGGDFGPFRSIEESILSQLTEPSTRSDVLSWHVTLPLLGSSLGSEASGRILHWLQAKDGWSEVDSYHAVFWIYAATGILNVLLVLPLTDACELQQTSSQYTQVAQDENENEAPRQSSSSTPLPATSSRNWLLERFAAISAPTRSVMYKLWLLLALDSLADGMVPFALTNYYLDTNFHPSKATLGDLTSASYFLGAVGAGLAGPLARKIGLINTMVFTHIPSSTAVLLFPFPPYFWMCAALFLVRSALNAMDQAPRAAFIAAVVKPEERTAVMGITATIRTLAATSGPTVTGLLASGKYFWVAFVVAGVCRLSYDFGLYALFVNMRLHQHEPTPMEQVNDGSRGQRLQDEEMELESIVDSDILSNDDDTVDWNVPVVKSDSLKLPSGFEHQRARSRSPHRNADS